MTPVYKKFLGPANRMMIQTLNGYLADGSMGMFPSENNPTTSGVHNITRAMIIDFAKDETLKTQEVYYIPKLIKVQPTH